MDLDGLRDNPVILLISNPSTQAIFLEVRPKDVTEKQIATTTMNRYSGHFYPLPNSFICINRISSPNFAVRWDHHQTEGRRLRSN
jgi:hypothetical protein